MELQKLSLSLLLLLGLFAEGYSKKTSPKPEPEPDNKKLTANFDKIFDQLLPFVQKFIRENGMDPMPLGSFSERVVPLPGKLQGNINFRNGFLHHMSELRRMKHVTAQYFNKRLLLDMSLGWQILDFNYEYDFKQLLAKRQGDLYGRFVDADFNVVIELDFNKYEVMLHKVESIRIGDINIKLYGHKLDPILNQIVKAVTSIFRNRIIQMIEQQSTNLVQPIFDSVNKWIKNPIHKSESFASSL